MNNPIEIKINNADLISQLLDELVQGTRDLSPLMRKLAGTMEKAVLQNFESGGRPAWKALKYRKGKPLIDTGTLLYKVTFSIAFCFWDMYNLLHPK